MISQRSIKALTRNVTNRPPSAHDRLPDLPGTCERGVIESPFNESYKNGRNIGNEVGVSLSMRKRWRIVLPVIGLALFSAETYHSLRFNREMNQGKYFWWSSFRLNSDPLNRQPKRSTPCKNGEKNCWQLQEMWVDPGLLAQFQIWSAFPAFVTGGLAVVGLGRLGISQVLTFMFLMPVLIVIWYYCAGWVLDRWLSRRRSGSLPR